MPSAHNLADGAFSAVRGVDDVTDHRVKEGARTVKRRSTNNFVAPLRWCLAP